MRVAREWRITDAGRARLQELKSLACRSEAEIDDLALLELCEIEHQSIPDKIIRNLPGATRASARLLRRGELSAQEVAQHRAPRMQKIVAWVPGATVDAGARSTDADARVERVLAEERGPLPLPKLLTLAHVSRAVIARLERNGKVRVWEEPALAEPDLLQTDVTPPSNVLNEDQQRAVLEIDGWITANTFIAGLLFGVTGSGKTEVYLRAIEAALGKGRSALILVPEIALTLWVGRLCRAWFGDALGGAGVAVLHSGLRDRERAHEWWRVRRGEARVIVGTRSAVFAPIENLGLIIVDEEQEASYKQEETPRYHGRDVAVMRGKLENAVVLLASATPSLESFHHARQGKYKLLRLDSRIENRPMAAVEIVDLREDFRQSHRCGPDFRAPANRHRRAIGRRYAISGVD